MVLAAHFILLSTARPPQLILNSTRKVTALAWTPNHQLLTVTNSSISEWPRGRTCKLSSSEENYSGLRLNNSGTRALGDGFVLDTLTFRAVPHPSKSPSYAVWESDRIVDVHSIGPGKFELVRRGHRTRVAAGWYILGVSPDLKFALATHRAPFDGDATYLLEINHLTGKAKVRASFPDASNDHVMLDSVERNPISGKLLLHTTDVASGFIHPFFASPTLQPLSFATPADVLSTSSQLHWIPGSGSWLTLRRQLFHERDNGRRGYDAVTLDLWNYKTGQMVRLSKLVFSWGPGLHPADDRGNGPTIGAYAVDWSRHRAAYAVDRPGSSQVVVQDFSDP